MSLTPHERGQPSAQDDLTRGRHRTRTLKERRRKCIAPTRGAVGDARADAPCELTNCRSGQQAAGLRRVSWRPCVSLRESFFAHRFHEFKPAILNGKHAADVPLGKPTERRGRYRWGCDNQPLLSKGPLRKCVTERPPRKMDRRFSCCRASYRDGPYIA